MGRFASTAEFYARYREPYTPEFFKTIAERLNFHKVDRLLDVGCGPALLAIGFAPYVGSCTGIDPEPNMLVAARQVMQETSIRVDLRSARLEDFISPTPFDIITIGRAIHWLDRFPSLASLNRLLATGGRILNCGAETDPELTAWSKPYNDLRNRFADLDHSQYRDNGPGWFAGSPFHPIADITVPFAQAVTIDDLIGRSHSKSNTSPAVLGGKRTQLEMELRSLLAPFAENGLLKEYINGRATIYAR